jgi:hypothetical protein
MNVSYPSIQRFHSPFYLQYFFEGMYIKLKHYFCVPNSFFFMPNKHSLNQTPEQIARDTIAEQMRASGADVAAFREEDRGNY